MSLINISTHQIRAAMLGEGYNRVFRTLQIGPTIHKVHQRV